MAMKRKGAIIGILVVGVLIVISLYLYARVFVPNKKLRDTEWLEKVSQKEVRDTAHQVIRFPMGNHHDAFLLLEKVGNKESVPLLIASLKWQDLPEDENDLMICTAIHCLEALQSLTGHDAGEDYRAWEKWWAETGSELPPAHFHYREILKKPLEEGHTAGIFH